MLWPRRVNSNLFFTYTIQSKSYYLNYTARSMLKSGLLFFQHVTRLEHMFLLWTSFATAPHTISAMTPHERHGVSNQQQPHSKVKQRVHIINNETLRLCMTGTFWGNPPVISGFLSQRAIMRKVLPCHDIGISLETVFLNEKTWIMRCYVILSVMMIRKSKYYTFRKLNC